MSVSVVVSPRERFSSIIGSLESLFSTIGRDVPVIVVEGATPDRIRTRLRELAKDRPFTHVSRDYMITPNEARNIGADLVQTPYIVFVDNDIEYEDGWLEPLVRNIEETGAAAVAPLTFIGPPKSKRIHQAGGHLDFSLKNGKPTLGERHRLSNADIDDIASELETLAPVHTDVFEFHCVMMRKEAWAEMGGFDERLITREHMDAALRLRALGRSVTFEKDSKVTYRAFDPMDVGDLAYYLFRWSDHRAVQSMDAFEGTWGVMANRDVVRWRMVAARRFRGVKSAFPSAARIMSQKVFRRGVVRPLEMIFKRREMRERSRSGHQVNIPKKPAVAQVSELFPDRQPSAAE